MVPAGWFLDHPSLKALSSETLVIPTEVLPPGQVACLTKTVLGVRRKLISVVGWASLLPCSVQCFKDLTRDARLEHVFNLLHVARLPFIPCHI